MSPAPGDGSGCASARLEDVERERLLVLARCAIRDALLHDGSLASRLERTEITPALRERRGMFVTLKLPETVEGRVVEQLRGCLGTLEPDRSLVPTLVELAPKAATADPRFPPLNADELGLVRISLSILTPPKPIADPAQVVIGEHGVQLVKNLRRSVFLPQVAVEQGWGTDQLLEHLALKAGLPRDGWRGGQLSVFRTEAFGESRDRPYPG